MTIEEFNNEVGSLEDMKSFCKDYGYEDYWDDLDLIYTDDLDGEIEERVRDILRYDSWKEAYSFLGEIDDYSETNYHWNDSCFSPVTYEKEIDIINSFRDYLEGDGFLEEEPEEAVEEEEESEEAEPEPEPLELIDTTTPENVEQFVLEENNEDNEDEFWDTEEEEEYLEEAVTEVLEKYSANVMEELNKFLLGGY